MATPFSPDRSEYSVADLRNWAAVTAGSEYPIRLAVFGDPVAHSASPPMQNAALEAGGLAARYARIRVPAQELAEALRLVAAERFIGVNLTIPHKAAVLPLLHRVDAHAAALGAVNTVRVEADGTLHGFNTDGPGFVRAARAEFGLELAGARVLILGAAGGAGRALAAECVLAGCSLVGLVNRTQARAQTLAVELADLARGRGSGTVVEAVAWKPVALASAARRVDLVVNTSSLGLKHSDPSPLTAAQLSTRPAVFDTVYRADDTPTALVAVAQQAGARTAGGRVLLLHQGALSFEHWFGQPAPLEIMRAALRAQSAALS
jgi:shikimate dehydrogenase